MRIVVYSFLFFWGLSNSTAFAQSKKALLEENAQLRKSLLEQKTIAHESEFELRSIRKESSATKANNKQAADSLQSLLIKNQNSLSALQQEYAFLADKQARNQAKNKLSQQAQQQLNLLKRTLLKQQLSLQEKADSLNSLFFTAGDTSLICTVEEGYLSILLSKKYTFSGSKFRPEMSKMASLIVLFLKKHQGLKLEIESHTTPVGTPQTNLKATTRKAVSLTALFSKNALEEQRISILAKGASALLNDANPKDLTNNRMVLKMMPPPLDIGALIQP